jgi:signal transduction histidine kinase
VKGYGELVADRLDHLPATAKDADLSVFAARLRQATDALEDTLEAMLDMARITQGTLKARRDRVDPVELLQAASALCSREAVTRSVTLRVSADMSLPTLRGDARLLRQALCNLVFNAIRHSGAEDVSLSLKRQPDGDLEIAVMDRGVGMSGRKAAASRGGASFGGTSPCGTGLGLPLCHKVAALHGGRLEIRTSRGKGTCAALMLPASLLVRRGNHAQGALPLTLH